MKRFIVFLLVLAIWAAAYNFSVLRGSLLGSFGDRAYLDGDFSGAREHYSDILKDSSGSGLLEADTFYNLGNALYRIGEKAKDAEKPEIWQKSLDAYIKSLSLRNDTETEENLAFVKEQLEKEKKKQEEDSMEKDEKTGSGADKKPQQPWDAKETNGKDPSAADPENSQPWEKGKDSEAKKSGTWNESGNDKPQWWQNWSNQGSYRPIGGQDKDETKGSPLSPADRQEAQKYLEELKRFQEENGKLLHPDKWEAGSIPDQIRNFFGSDPFFQDIIPDDDGKKDW